MGTLTRFLTFSSEVASNIVHEKRKRLDAFLRYFKHKRIDTFRYKIKKDAETRAKVKLRKPVPKAAALVQRFYANNTFTRFWYELSILNCTHPDLLLEVDVRKDQPVVIVHFMDYAELDDYFSDFEPSYEFNLSKTLKKICVDVILEAEKHLLFLSCCINDPAACCKEDGGIDFREKYPTGKFLSPLTEEDVLLIAGNGDIEEWKPELKED